jgi:hypothetical protein
MLRKNLGRSPDRWDVTAWRGMVDNRNDNQEIWRQFAVIELIFLAGDNWPRMTDRIAFNAPNLTVQAFGMGCSYFCGVAKL